MIEALTRHWPEYLMEGAELGTFMVSASLFAVILEHPASPVRQAVADPFLRRAVMGLAMGLTAVGVIYSPWGKQSGAHFNPAVTLTFFRLGLVEPWDAFFYVVSQFAGGLVGLLLAAAALRGRLADPAVDYVVTVPGALGPGVAFQAEFLISLGLMLMVLALTNTPRLARFTGLFVGALIAIYVAVEAPFSGMSMNPARTLGSAVPARMWTGLWVYFTAPPLGMLAAAAVYAWSTGGRRARSAKLHHDNRKRCIFRCSHH